MSVAIAVVLYVTFVVVLVKWADKQDGGLL